MSSSSAVNRLVDAANADFQEAQGLNVPQIQSPQTLSPNGSVPQDTVSISQEAQQLAQSMAVPQSTAAIVERLHAEGVPTDTIAAELESASDSVESYITAGVLSASA
jgi:hypothetical protein